MKRFRLGMSKRFGDRSVSLLQDDTDGALSAPEMPSIRRDRGITFKSKRLSSTLKHTVYVAKAYS